MYCNFYLCHQRIHGCLLQITFQKAFEITYFKKSYTEEAKSVSTLHRGDKFLYVILLYIVVIHYIEQCNTNILHLELNQLSGLASSIPVPIPTSPFQIKVLKSNT